MHWQRDPSFFKITFLRQEQYDSIAETDLFIYTQDFTNKTHFVKCTTVPFTKNVTCEDDGYIAEVNHKILNLTANRFHYYEGKYIHLVAIVYESLPNEIFIYEAEDRTQFARPIIFPKGYEGQI